MVSQSGIKAGAAYVELFLKDKLSRGLQRASARLKTWGASMQSMGTRMVAVSAAMALPIAMVTRSFADFDDQMRTVKAVTGATGRDFDMLTAKAKLLGRTTSYTASEVAAGMVEAGRAGFDPGQIDASIAAMLDLARATGTELPLATNIAAGTLRAFSMEAAKMGDVADILTAAANNSAQTLEDMGEAMKYTAPVAAEYGMTLQETARMIGYLANFSIRGTMAGTTMKNIMLKLADPKISKQVKALGIDVSNAAGGMRPLADVMSEIGVAVQSLPAAERLALFKELFGLRAIAGGAKLTASSFKKLDESIANFSGTAARTAKEMDSGIGGVLRRLWSAMEGVVLAIGDALAPALEAAAVPMGQLAGMLTRLIEKNPQFVRGVLKVVAGVAAVGAGALVAGTAIVGLGMVFGGLATISTTLAGVFGGIVAAVGALLSPVGLLATALVGLGGYFVYTSGAAGQAIDWIKAKFSELGQWTSKIFDGIRTAMAAGDMALAGEILMAALKMAWQKGVSALTEAWAGFKDQILSIWSTATFKIAEWGTRAWSSLKTGWVETVAGMKIAWIGFTESVQNHWEGAQKTIGKGVAWIIAKIEGLDPAAVMADVERQYDLKRTNRKQDNRADVERIARESQAKVAQIKEERRQALDSLNAQAEADRRKRQESRAKTFAESQRELDEARQNLDASLAKAKSPGQKARVGKGAAEGRPELPKPEQIAKAGQSGSAAGTFNAFAIGGMAASNETARIAKATEKTAALLAIMERRRNRGKFTFVGADSPL